MSGMIWVLAVLLVLSCLMLIWNILARDWNGALASMFGTLVNLGGLWLDHTS